MKQNNEIKQLAKIFLPINIGISLVASIVLFIVLDYSYGLGYLIGSLFSTFTFILHMIYANSFGPNQSPKIKLTCNLGVRTLINIGALFIGYFLDKYIKFLTLAIGLCVIQLILLIFCLIYYNTKDKRLVKQIKKEESQEGSENNVND